MSSIRDILLFRYALPRTQLPPFMERLLYLVFWRERRILTRDYVGFTDVTTPTKWSTTMDNHIHGRSYGHDMDTRSI